MEAAAFTSLNILSLVWLNRVVVTDESRKWSYLGLIKIRRVVVIESSEGRGIDV